MDRFLVNLYPSYCLSFCDGVSTR